MPPLAPILTVLLFASALGCERRPAPGPSPRQPSVASAPASVSVEGTVEAPSASLPVQNVPLQNVPAKLAWPQERRPTPVADRGIYPDLDDRVRLRLPPWLDVGPWVVIEAGGTQARYVAIDGVVVGFAPATLPTTIRVDALTAWDRDGDHIPDPLDILIGAKKTVLNGAAYKSTYRVIPYPGGDMPRTEGVCTDVIVRALRNAGIDLQKEIHEDAKARRSAYPGITKPDKNIDHRRVRNLLPFFKRTWKSLPVDPKDRTVPWMPGDVVFLDTMNDAQPEHMGIVSDELAPSGFPLIINNWTDGTKTAEMDLLSFVPVRQRFRVSMGALPVPVDHRGPEGVLTRCGLNLDQHRQLLLVTTPTWRAAGGVLRKFQRKDGNARWMSVGAGIPVTVGAGGLGTGRGLHDRLPGALATLEPKREGDLRSPAGVFRLGEAFGPHPAAPYAPGMWPWKHATDRDRWIDDPSSPHYNTWQRAGGEWSSAEDLSEYRLGLIVEHNRSPVHPGAGSAIFIHEWRDASTPTSGCTALAHEELNELLRWLDPAAEPVLVQVAGQIFDGSN